MRPSSVLTIIVAAAVTLLLGGCAGLEKRGSSARLPITNAQLTDSAGADRGQAEAFRDGSGLRLEIVARGFNPGTYGMHIHTIGKCDAPDFTSAGPHWNPTGAQHGRDNPLGQHRGDLPNLVIESGMIGRATVTVPNAMLTGDSALLDGDGASFIIHAQADDLKTDPTGNSGGRIVCGVFNRR